MTVPPPPLPPPLPPVPLPPPGSNPSNPNDTTNPNNTNPTNTNTNNTTTPNMAPPPLLPPGMTGIPPPLPVNTLPPPSLPQVPGVVPVVPLPPPPHHGGMTMVVPPPSILPPPLPPPGLTVAGAPPAAPMGLIPSQPQPQHAHSLQHRMLHHQHNPTTLVLTHVPDFLCHSRNLRDLIYPCGSCRSVSFTCEIRNYNHVPQHSFQQFPSKESISSNTGSANSGTKLKSSSWREKGLATAVVKMAHSSGAFNFCRNWDAAAKRLNLQQELQNQNEKEEKEKEDSNNDDEKDKSKKDKDTNTPTTPAKITMKVFLLASASEHIPLRPSLNPQDASIMETVWEGLWGVGTEGTAAADESLVVKLTEAYTAIRLRQESYEAAGTSVTIPGVVPTNKEEGKEGMPPSTSTTLPPTSVTNPVESVTAPPTTIDGAQGEETSTAATTRNKLDVSKVAAAAGGGAYDEEADPLNAPAVLDAVSKFKKRLEERDVIVKKKRAEFVNSRLKVEVEAAKKRLVEKKIQEEKEEEERKKKEEEEKILAKNAPVVPPPLPPPPLPPVGDAPTVDSTTSSSATTATAPLVAVPEGVKDSGRRGVSNLPSWMTKQIGTTTTNTTSGEAENPAPTHATAETNHDTPDSESSSSTRKRKFIPSEANRDINVRKQRLDTGEMSLAEIRAANQAADAAAAAAALASAAPPPPVTILETKEEILSNVATFPIVPSTQAPAIRTFVTEQIVEYLGEEETTLIDFVMNHLTQGGNGGTGSTTKALLEELEMVLEEDAATFVVDLYRKIVKG